MDGPLGSSLFLFFRYKMEKKTLMEFLASHRRPPWRPHTWLSTARNSDYHHCYHYCYGCSMCMDRTENNTLIRLVLTSQKPKAFASRPQTQSNSPGCPGTKAAASLPISKDGPQFPDTRCSQLLEQLALEGAYKKRVSKQVRERMAEKAHDRGILTLGNFKIPQYSYRAFIEAFQQDVRRTLVKSCKMRRYTLRS